MNDIYTEWLTRKVGDPTTLIEGLIKEGWKPVTPERQPYIVNIIGALMPGLAEAGFTRVETPVFQINSINYIVVTRRLPAQIIATDLPGDLPNVNTQLLPMVIEQLHKLNSTHILSVSINRTPLFGYLPPTVDVCTRSAHVRPQP